MLIGRRKTDNFRSTLHRVTRESSNPFRMSTKPIPLTSYQIRLLAVLALINFVNFAARQVFVPLIPLLRDHLHVTDAELGSLQTFLLLVLAVGSIPFGFLADRFSRKAIIAIGIVCWSVATFVGGLTSNFLFFLIARSVVGLGEAAYAPAAQSMISGVSRKNAVPSRKPSLLPGCCLEARPAMFWAGSLVRDTGGRKRFLSWHAPGLFLGSPFSGLRNRRADRALEVVPIGRLLQVPAFVAMICAGICITFSSVSLLTWSTDFAVNYKDFSLREASVLLAVIGLSSALLGVLTGGFVADRLHRSFLTAGLSPS